MQRLITKVLLHTGTFPDAESNPPFVLIFTFANASAVDAIECSPALQRWEHIAVVVCESRSDVRCEPGMKCRVRVDDGFESGGRQNASAVGATECSPALQRRELVRLKIPSPVGTTL